MNRCREQTERPSAGTDRVLLCQVKLEEVLRRQNFHPRKGHMRPDHISVIRRKKMMRCLRLYHDIIKQ